jgi:hypothetical protein
LSARTASFFGSPVCWSSKTFCAPCGSAITGRRAALEAVGVEVVVEAVGVAGEVVILSEFVEELLLQAVRRRAAVRAVVATAVAVGRVVRDT